MDVFAHGLWSYAVFSKTKHRWLAALFGVLPDVLSFGPHFFWELGNHGFGRPSLASIPGYVFAMYNFTHSLIPVSLVLLVVYLLTRKVWLPLLAWLMHVLVDIPTHTAAFFPTPFLWPFETPFVSGVSWGNPVFMALNYGSLILVYALYVFRKEKRRRESVV